jgi:hypothetical protein
MQTKSKPKPTIFKTESLKIMETQNETVKSITAWDWLINAVSVEN